jgi:hypothetical protein
MIAGERTCTPSRLDEDVSVKRAWREINALAGAVAAMTQLPDWTNRLLQELSAAQDQGEFGHFLAACIELIESLPPQEHELFVETVADIRFEHSA